MRLFKFLIILICSTNIAAQEIRFKLDKDFIHQFGSESDLVSFIPLFKLSSFYLDNGQQRLKIKKFPPSVSKENTAYGAILFNGLQHSSFEREVFILVEDYTAKTPTIYMDRNGNLDFNDDGAPFVLTNKKNVKLFNEAIHSAYYNYQLGKSKIAEENESSLRSRYAAKYPNSEIVSAQHWLTYKRLSVRVSIDSMHGKPITIFLIDNSIDGLFTFQTGRYGDRILIVEGIIDSREDKTSLFRQAEPIGHNAIFQLYGQNYAVKNVSKNGDELTLSITNQDTRVVFKEEQDLSSLNIHLLNGTSIMVKDLLKSGKHLLIDVGGTWCGGCIRQEPVIKKIYQNGAVEVVGLFDYDTQESVHKYVEKHHIEWPVALVDSTFKESFRITSFPTYILVSPKGKIILADTNAEVIVNHFKK